MVTYESAFQHVKPAVKAGVFAKLREANYDLEGEVDDSFLGLDDSMLKEAGLDLPERSAVKAVLHRLKEGGSVFNTLYPQRWFFKAAQQWPAHPHVA